MDRSGLTVLLAAYRMTFFWGAINKTWRITGPAENGCSQDTSPEPAENFNEAEAAAVRYIQKKYTLAK